MSINFTKFVTKKVFYEDLGHAFDVRTQAKTDEAQVREIQKQKEEGVAHRLPFVSSDLFEIDGRHEIEGQKRFSGEENPLIEVNVFTWNWEGLSSKDQETVKNWALHQNLNQPDEPARRFASYDDIYQRILDLVSKSDWTDSQVRKEFSGSISNQRITKILTTVRKVRDNQIVDSVRKSKKANPKADIEGLVVGMGVDSKDVKKLVRRAEEESKKRPGGDGLRWHKFSGRMRAAVNVIEKQGQAALDLYRDKQVGRSGLSKSGYLRALKEFRKAQNLFNDVANELISRGLTEMNLPSDSID